MRRPATVYGTKVEMIFGKWLESRGMLFQPRPGKRVYDKNEFIQRKDLYLIGKGGHPYHRSMQKLVLADDIRNDITSSLANLKCAYFDLYLLHRDDPEDFLHQLVVDCNLDMNDLSKKAPLFRGDVELDKG